MVTRALAAVVLAAVVLAAGLVGCGSNSTSGQSTTPRSAPQTFPAAKANPAGLYYAPVPDAATADRLCNAAQAHWPTAYSGHAQVTFDVPHTGSDVTCMRP